jgi:hypothetical protein
MLNKNIVKVVVLLIDIENELKAVQIKYIQTELKKLKDCYYSSIADYSYDRICESYEEMISETELLAEQLLLYKQYYISAMEYLFRNLESEEETVEFAKVEDIQEDTNLPFD